MNHTNMQLQQTQCKFRMIQHRGKQRTTLTVEVSVPLGSILYPYQPACLHYLQVLAQHRIQHSPRKQREKQAIFNSISEGKTKNESK
jgi:hypothetical protein